MSTLLTVTGNRLKLEPNHSYTFGRDGDCDFVVQDMTVSRRHARLLVGKDPNAVILEDLGSRNGTYVNERRVKGRTPLDDGSRIRVGSFVYLLSHVDEGADEEAMLDTGTVAIERLSFGKDVNEEILRVVRREAGEQTDFAGQLGSFGLIEVIQLLMQTHRNGTLHIALESGHATIEVRNGDITSATFQELEGFPALLMLARQKHGIFWLVDKVAPVPVTIKEPASRLLLELCRALDEKDLA